MNERILVVDDEPDIRNLVSDILTDEGYQVNAAASANKARQYAQEMDYDLVLLDIWMPEEDGITLLKDWQQKKLIKCPIVMMSGHGTVETAVEATRLGAFSFVEKPLTTAKLITTIRAALDEYKKHSQFTSRADEQIDQPVGNSQLMKSMLELCERCARIDSHLLAIGEVGSGRQTILKYIHQISERKQSPFIVMDTSSLFETALSDNDCSRFNTLFVDTIKQAQGGTVCLPDVHTIDASIQKRICGLMKQLVSLKMFERFDVRFCISMALGHEKDCVPEMQKVFSFTTLQVPALRDHAEDIPELVNSLIDTFSSEDNYPYSKCSIAAQNALLHYQWPGNISELKCMIKQLLLDASDGEITIEDVEKVLPKNIDSAFMHYADVEHLFDLPLREAREMFEKEYLVHQLNIVNGSVSKLADRVGMERTHLYRKLRSLGIGAKDSA